MFLAEKESKISGKSEKSAIVAIKLCLQSV